MTEFKFPLAFASKHKKLDRFDGLPQFSWEELAGQDVIGQGTFGAVFVTQYEPKEKPGEKVVVKKLLSTAEDFTETFVKETNILNELHLKNIVSSFKAVCKEPVAMMLEYVYFDLGTFGGEEKMSSLKKFLSCLDLNDCEGIGVQFIEKIASDVISGLKWAFTKPGPDQIGSDRIGSDRIGSDRIRLTKSGPDRTRSDRIHKTWIGLRPTDKTRKEGGDDGRDKIHRLLENGKKPLGSTKYHQKCQTEWLNVWNLYEASTNFNSSNRPDASELLNMLGKVMQGGCGYTQNLAKGNAHLEVQAADKTSAALCRSGPDQLGKDDMAFSEENEKAQSKETIHDVEGGNGEGGESSTRDKLKESAFIKSKTAKESLDEVYRSVGDVTKARSAGQLPRGPRDLYNAPHSTKKLVTESFRCEDDVTKDSSSEHISLDNIDSP
ncbi:hypothetical protein AWC38_SpisGene11470 [Stylophora pistillata]|uniref:Tyrosine-protein kinase catalytic domain-containing protein n=1 Tax=Stylophora pistillata TaxID=50429 RepID=A0A2B4S5T8_STYPI|nr:hypothetical protein AWC38_SpisGene11470 [Stylophora pistillata]